MAVTTYADIRDAQIAAIAAITPTSHSGTKFIVSLDEVDFRAWADAQPQAAFRRHTIEHLSEEREGPVLDTERVHVTAEIVVAYPRDRRYGPANKRDRDDAMEADRTSLERAAGVVGYGNMGPDAAVYETQWTRERSVACDFLVITYRVAFYRSTGL